MDRDPHDPPTLPRDDDDGPATLVRHDRADSSPPDRGDDHTRIIESPYAVGDVIGAGGMGEVVVAHDNRMGRDIAIKRLKKASPSEPEIARFLREARIQARLEHPAIVPVYELGRDVDGRPYFTMKRVTGATLLQMLPTEPAISQRLLRAFAEVCLAIEFAHTRGIVHRDLKPGNIMLGDFGEIYVLDWGLARVIGDGATPLVTNDIESLDGFKEPTQVLGTPGYIAPEQLQSPNAVGRASDVYALGAILFELLTKSTLHPRATQPAIASTVSPQTVVSPAQRLPSVAIPPELDVACTAALALDPTRRPTARQLGERVQAYLDGDRDLVRRKQVATEQLWQGRTALERGDRAEAMHCSGRALALDPDLSGAAELVTGLMLQPPREAPPELEAALRTADENGVRRHARTAIVAYVALASFLPVAMWNGILRWSLVLAVFGMALVMAGFAWSLRRYPVRTYGGMLIYGLGNALLLGLLSRMAGPFTFVPALNCIITMSTMTYPQFTRRPEPLIGLMVLAFLVPVGLEIAGVVSQTWEVRSGFGLISHAGALEIRPGSTVIMVVVASILTIVIAGIHAAALSRTSRDAQHQLVTQAWHLRQLLPATPATSSSRM